MFSYLHLTLQLKPHSGIARPQLLWKVKPSFFDLTGHQSQTFLTLTTTEEDHPKIVTFWLRPCRQINKIWIYNLVFHPQACAVVCWHTVVNHCQNVLLFSQRHQLRLVTLCHPPFSVGSDVQRVSHGRYYHCTSTVKRVSGEIKPLTFHLSAKIARSQTDSCSLYEVWLQYPPVCGEAPLLLRLSDTVSSNNRLQTSQLPSVWWEIC